MESGYRFKQHSWFEALTTRNFKCLVQNYRYLIRFFRFSLIPAVKFCFGTFGVDKEIFAGNPNSRHNYGTSRDQFVVAIFQELQTPSVRQRLNAYLGSRSDLSKVLSHELIRWAKGLAGMSSSYPVFPHTPRKIPSLASCPYVTSWDPLSTNVSPSKLPEYDR